MIVIDACCPGTVFYRDQKDMSSQVRLRPDATMFKNGALFAKLEEKASSVDLDHAASELCSKFHMNAGKLFPLGSDCILGIVAAKFIITTYKIISRDGGFESVFLRSYNFKTVIPRIDFLYDIIRYMRFVASITGPKESFHLVPDIRMKTTNGHHVTWTNDGLYKVYRKISEQQIDRMKFIYQNNLPNVEHGRFLKNRTFLVTRIGYTLNNALMKKLVNRSDAFEQVKNGMIQLHECGLAHCDIRLRNVFVDLHSPFQVFLDDLEYLTPIDATPLNFPEYPRSAAMLDKEMLDVFYNDIMST
jgi:hypothetical protein